MVEPTITLEVSKFKELLLYGWHLLPPEKQQELLMMGIYPKPSKTAQNASETGETNAPGL